MTRTGRFVVAVLAIATMAGAGSAYKTFEAPHTSYLVVIDKKGVVVYTGVGGTQDVETAIAKAMVSQ